MAKRARLSWAPEEYTPSNIKAMLEAGKESIVRKEYTRLRDISQKRLKRLKAAGYENTEVYRSNVNHYPLLKNIKSKSELAQRLSDLSRFILSERSTVSGLKDLRSRRVKALHEHGFTFVDDSNYGEFAEFMEAYKNELLDMEYDSGDAAELYGVVVKHKLDPEKVKGDFEFWLENIDAAMKMRRSKRTTGNYEAFYDKVWNKVKASRKV